MTANSPEESQAARSGGAAPLPPRRALLRKILIDLAIMTVIGVVLALIGPFGSFEQPLALRLFAWITFAYIGYAIYSPMSALVGRLRGALDLPAALLWVLAVLVATVPMTAVVWTFGFLPGPVRAPTLEEGMTSYFYVLVVGGGVTALFYALESRSNNGVTGRKRHGAASDDPAAVVEEETAAAAEPDHPRFIDRLPAHLGTKLLALEMEDHYVRAHTTLGSELVLMRMRDAMAELDGIAGQQVHRSWWVARDAVEDVRREGRNVRLVLSGGLEAPVSRANVQPLKDAGWL